MAEIEKELGEKLAGELKSKLEEYTKAADEKNEGRLKDIKSELETLSTKYQDEISKMPEMQKQLDTVSTELKKAKQELGSSARAVGMTAQKMLEKDFKEQEEAFKAFREDPKSKAPKQDFELKVVGNMTFGGSTTGQVVDNDYIPGIFGEVRRRNRIRQFIPTGSMSGDKIPYVVQSGGEGAALNVDEGTSKPQADKDIELKTAAARKIAIYSRMSEEILDDLPAISTFVTTQLTADVYDKEDQQLLYGTGAGTPTQIEGLTVISGILTASNVPAAVTAQMVNNIDAVIGAMAALANANFMADTIIMNPADMYNIILLKDDDNNYLKRINFTQNGELVINGLVVRTSTAVTQGEFMVAEMGRAATLFQRSGLSVRFYDQDQDNAIKNLVTVVVEERLALAIPRPGAIFYDAFADVTALT